MVQVPFPKATLLRGGFRLKQGSMNQRRKERQRTLDLGRKFGYVGCVLEVWGTLFR